MREVCFIDKEGGVGVCTEDTIASCEECDFRKYKKGKEHDEFSYCAWIGDL